MWRSLASVECVVGGCGFPGPKIGNWGTRLLEICGLPPFPQRARKGWGTRPVWGSCGFPGPRSGTWGTRYWRKTLGLFLLVATAICSPLFAQTPLRVAAAADLEPVLPPILDQFRQATGIQAEATFKSSALLATQIQNGAPFDLFLSADMGFPKKLIDAGLADAAGSADSSTPILYARGTLVLWMRDR